MEHKFRKSDNGIALQDLASFFCVTPNYLSTIRKDITFEAQKLAPLSLSSLRLSPSAPDFRALPRAFLCRFSVPLPNKTDEQ